ncbi:alcohol dehydrogenase [Vibrio sp. UCD-FRSSP16_10]|uniref:iron-containing alcohol dehydrogenase n=1 Tax=unclassified Vibrio TaxID=2614977 RepID=UPI0007FF0216|nr:MULTISPECIES: iron-containing alcohol dehydrogenase [unclassified Vibrio]OBT12095.1 alcohol dehydrogenase [Vibrio sp. UCD-FRSSP16_30]OBT20426.1 alcohol dehydrogenase [Vibrio sp. UCD-FRSSP16_10]
MFQFMTTSKIVFGEGTLQSSLSLLNQFGYSVLLVTGKNLARSEMITAYLKSQSMRYQHISVSREPTISMVEEAALLARRFKPDMVVAMGGGSVIDMGKALSAMITNSGDLYDYVEVIGRNVPIKSLPLPMIAIPTTASTGSEVTKSAVLKSTQDKVKVSLRGPEILPTVAIVDPTLTYGTDLETSARGAMDAFTHLMEAYVCGDPNPLTDMICEEGLRKLAGSILPACRQDNPRARSDLSFAAMLGGMATTNAKLGAAHGLAAALGGKITAPHSVITARLAPFVMTENMRMAKQSGRNDVLTRYRKIAQLVTENSDAHREDGVNWVNSMLEQLEVPTLSYYDAVEGPLDLIAQDAMKSVAIKGNPLPLTKDRLVDILNQVYGDSTLTVRRAQDNVSKDDLNFTH